MCVPAENHHPPPEQLAPAASDEPLPPPVEQHVLRCAMCRSTVAWLLRVVAAGRAGPVEPTAPPESVWEGIRRRL